MHHIEFKEIMREAEIAHVILPVVREHRLTEAETEEALLKLNVPQAANIARICVALGLIAVRRARTLRREAVNFVNGASGWSDIEGKTTRVGASESG
jgi:hypothetical protein